MHIVQESLVQFEQLYVGQTHIIMHTMGQRRKHEGVFIEGTTYIHNTDWHD